MCRDNCRQYAVKNESHDGFEGIIAAVGDGTWVEKKKAIHLKPAPRGVERLMHLQRSFSRVGYCRLSFLSLFPLSLDA